LSAFERDQATGAIGVLVIWTVGVEATGLAASNITAISSAFIMPHVNAQKMVSTLVISASWLVCRFFR
jgi:hypothetical protein